MIGFFILSKIIKSKWNKHIGFHSHDNRSLALSNSLEAIKNSINFIDSTILGMGRGAGNLQTEKILFELKFIIKLFLVYKKTFNI